MIGPETSTTEPQHRWVLQLDDHTTVSRAAARRIPLVDPELVAEALAAAKRHPSSKARVVVFGRDAAERLVQACLPRDAAGAPDAAGCDGERAAAVRWLSAAPRARWRRVRADVQEAGR